MHGAGAHLIVPGAPPPPPPRQLSAGACPSSLCRTKTCPASCQLGGACQDGTCYCDLMFTGTDCTEKLTANGSYAK